MTNFLNPRLLLIAQLVGTLLILAFLPGNISKLVLFLILWGLTFRRISREELIFATLISLFFTGMNALSLKQGIFQFNNPDILGMPLYELFMWGFYVMHTSRMLGPTNITKVTHPVWILALLYSVAFGVIPDQTLLFVVTAGLLMTGLILFHQKKDIAYILYMILLGAAIEYTGVLSGEWGYPGNPPGGVPIWFITLWGGVGLFLHRLALPLLRKSKSNPTHDILPR